MLGPLLRAYEAESGAVELATKKGEVFTLSGVELLRRFLLHVLPKSFHRVRHYGLFAPRAKARRERARAAIVARRRAEAAVAGEGEAAADFPTSSPAMGVGDEEQAGPEPGGESAAALYQALTGIDLSRCPRCDGRLESRPLRPADGHAAALMRAVGRRRESPT